jgi:S-adenosylmethionine decarboxylase
MIADIKNIKNTDLLNDLEKLKKSMIQICNNYSFHILGEIEHRFTPEGCSIIFLLSESHMTIHTFPEKQYIAFDLYTCRNYADNSEYIKIYEYLINILEANNSSLQIIDRNF